ncbi:MAG: thiol:disulfide interchange protein [Rhodospirillales bacterium]|nr:thiol:disulfide interchange protein [Rhodospirillales bacterium]
MMIPANLGFILTALRLMAALRPFARFAAFSLALVASPAALAQAGDPGDGPHATVSLIAQTKTVTPGQKLQVALVQKIEKGWHTYWVNPGDSGLPTMVEWSLPTGIKAEPIAWPTPKRIPYGPLVSYGYEDQVVLPVTITVPTTVAVGTDVALTGHASWLVCSNVCVPEEGDLKLVLPGAAGPAALDPDNAAIFAAALAQLPTDNPFTAKVSFDKDRIRLHVATGDAGKLTDVGFFPLDEGVIDNDIAPEITAGRDGVTVTLKRAQSKDKPLDTLNGVLVFHDSSAGQDGASHAIRIAAPATAGSVTGGVANAPTIGFAVFIEAVLLAIAGGIVLNLMPCVLPVLSIKALSLVRHAQSAPREVRMQGLAYAAGVLVSFAAVAGALIALRAAGAEIGWGFQLQSPIFLTIMIYVLFAVGLSLSGVFTVGDGAAGLGSELADREGYSGSFFTGALATLVATPCTAPFMAAAIGFAITQPWFVSFAVLEAIGVGLALPYVLLAFSPSARRFLPKPGAWMNSLKQVLAFPVYGTAVWLAFVLSSEAGSIGVTAALAGLVLIAFAAWLYETVRLGEGAGRRIGLAGAALAVVAALALVKITDVSAGASPVADSRPVVAGGVSWQPFSQAKLDAARAEGKPVFVDFTADWCITCKVNERVALADQAVTDAFAAQGIVALRGDWTRRDGEITRILEANGRGGVPLYLFYAKGSSDKPVILPQILTADIVLHSMQGG